LKFLRGGVSGAIANRDSQFLVNCFQKFHFSEVRVIDIAGQATIMAMNMAANRGFSGTNLTNQQHEATSILNTLTQGDYGLPVFWGEIEEVRIRGVPKWFAPQAEAISIHIKPLFTGD
jgi:hypothetical protein